MSKHYVLVEIDTNAPERSIPDEQRSVMRGAHREFGNDLLRYWGAKPMTDEPVGHRGALMLELTPELHYDAVIDDGNPPEGYIGNDQWWAECGCDAPRQFFDTQALRDAWRTAHFDRRGHIAEMYGGPR